MLIGLGLGHLWPARILPRTPQYVLGVVVVAASFALIAVVLRKFKRSRTSFNAHWPRNALVTQGPFRYSRNPAYVSLTMLYLGLGMLIGSAWVIGLVIPTLVTTHAGVVRREERYLERKFGDAYRGYRNRVRRWL